MKTFDELFAELTATGRHRARRARRLSPRSTPACTPSARRSSRRPPRSGWPPSTSRPSAPREEISQLLYHLQVLMLARGLTPRRRLRSPVTPHALDDRRLTPCCASPCPTRARCPSRPARCCARPATASAPTRASSSLPDPDNDVEFFFLRPRDIAVYVGSRQLDVGHHRARPAARLRRRRRGDPGARLRRVHASASPPSPAPRPRVADLAGRRVATSYPGLVAQAPRRRGASTPRSSGSTARSRPPSASVSPTSIADVVATGTTLRQAGLEIFGEPHPRTPRRC